MEQNKIAQLCLLVPCYNEEKSLRYCLETLSEIRQSLVSKNKISSDSYILFVDDGSIDQTWDFICEKTDLYTWVKGVRLSANRGSQVAILAGLFKSNSDLVISLDADLQDDVQCIEKMVDLNRQGYEIVYGQRKNRNSDSLLKRHSANLFYKLLDFMGVKQISHHADFRLMSRKAIDYLRGYDETNLYLRGLVPLLGLKESTVSYDRQVRKYGNSKFSMSKMIALGVDGLTSFSIAPLRLISLIGFLSCLVCLGVGIYTLVVKAQGEVVAGWASVMVSIYFLGSVQILCLGVIGEYIGKTYLEVKKRPHYHIQDTKGF